MNDYYLVFPNEAEWLAVADEAAGLAVDVVGVFYDFVEKTGLLGKVKLDADGNPLFDAVAREGWHVNIRCDELPVALDGYTIPSPSFPKRVWAQ